MNVPEALSNLNHEEYKILKSIPALVTILVGFADDNFNEHEIHMGELSTAFRKRAGNTIVKDYFEWVYNDYSHIFKQVYAEAKQMNQEDRLNQISEQIAQVNHILPKIDRNYALALVDSWRGLAKAIAHASGGMFGRFAVSFGESEVMDLNMINLK